MTSRRIILLPDNWFKAILLGKSRLLLDEPPLPRQQFAIWRVQSEVELSLDLLLVSWWAGSEFRSSIHKNFEARVLMRKDKKTKIQLYINNWAISRIALIMLYFEPW